MTRVISSHTPGRRSAPPVRDRLNELPWGYRDLNMLVLLGGHERTRGKYRRLLAGAGLRLRRVIAGEGYGILETVPVRRSVRRQALGRPA